MVQKSEKIFLPFCYNPRVWQTERQTDRILITRLHLHSTQRGKNQSAETGHEAISLADAYLPCRWWWDLSQVDEQNISKQQNTQQYGYHYWCQKDKWLVQYVNISRHVHQLVSIAQHACTKQCPKNKLSSHPRRISMSKVTTVVAIFRKFSPQIVPQETLTYF